MPIFAQFVQFCLNVTQFAPILPQCAPICRNLLTICPILPPICPTLDHEPTPCCVLHKIVWAVTVDQGSAPVKAGLSFPGTKVFRSTVPVLTNRDHVHKNSFSCTWAWPRGLHVVLNFTVWTCLTRKHVMAQLGVRKGLFPISKLFRQNWSSFCTDVNILYSVQASASVLFPVGCS